MSRFARQVDDNQAEVVEALRGAGAFVKHLFTVGRGVPDLLVGHRGRWSLFEVKDGSKPPSARALTPTEHDWHARAKQLGLPVFVASSPSEAVALLGGFQTLEGPPRGSERGGWPR